MQGCLLLLIIFIFIIFIIYLIKSSQIEYMSNSRRDDEDNSDDTGYVENELNVSTNLQIKNPVPSNLNIYFHNMSEKGKMKSSPYNYGAPGSCLGGDDQDDQLKTNYKTQPSVTGMFTETGPEGY